ncbi:hypothetical protein GGQ77_000576 [Geobacillus thermodenitrificans]|nr:hypothetical protein [Geobacillus thermodenitrificans]
MIEHVETSRRIVVLMFDEGPHLIYPPKMLNMLMRVVFIIEQHMVKISP